MVSAKVRRAGQLKGEAERITVLNLQMMTFRMKQLVEFLLNFVAILFQGEDQNLKLRGWVKRVI